MAVRRRGAHRRPSAATSSCPLTQDRDDAVFLRVEREPVLPFEELFAREDDRFPPLDEPLEERPFDEPPEERALDEPPDERPLEDPPDERPLEDPPDERPLDDRPPDELFELAARDELPL